MAGRGAIGAAIALLIVSIVLTVLVIPGVGLETRSTSAFPSWETMMFMTLGPLAILTALVGAATMSRWNRAGGSLAAFSGLLTLILSAIGLALLGAATAPTGVMDADIVHAVVSLILIPLGVAIAFGSGSAGSPPTSPP